MKEKILEKIYVAFEQWSASLPLACARGCATCCTGKVTITALEGERILRFILDAGLVDRLAGRLASSPPLPAPPRTTNAFAGLCLQGIETDDPDIPAQAAVCPFLEDDSCTIYPVRPFGCRCFASEKTCSPDEAAIVPEYYVAASTAVMQIIEHLGQGEYWGTMSDVLLALCDISRYKAVADRIGNPAMIVQARLRTARALPLPGFLLLEEEHRRIAPLLDAIFSGQVNGHSINDILNGRAQALPHM
jgi:hypothetical protein